MTSYEDRKRIFDTIKILTKPEHEDLFRILKKTRENYTENSNGIFFDLQTISEECYLKIKEYIDFCVKNRQEHENRLKELDELRNETYVDSSENDE
jgi:hypothetical protein